MKLANKSIDELVELRGEIERNPANRQNGFYLYTKSARRKFDEIDRAIAQLVREKRIASGDVINDAGYSGRQTTRR